MARAKNGSALPLIKSHCGLRLPPDRHCLVAANYKLRAAEVQPKKMTKSALDRANKTTKGAATALKRQSAAGVPKTQTVTIPKPVFKFSGNAKAGTATASGAPVSTIVGPGMANIKTEPCSSPGMNIKIEKVEKMDVDDEYLSSNGHDSLKRKREDDDDFEAVQ